MKSRLILLALVAIAAAGCKKEATREKIEDKDISMVPTVQEDCYAYKKDGNTIYMRLKKDNTTTVKGDLEYAFSEKDANKGTFEGTVKGDTLIAMYTFTSEGVESKREVAFLIKDKTLIEGYGEVEEHDSAVAFKNRSKLVFNSNMPLTKVDCKK